MTSKPSSSPSSDALLAAGLVVAGAGLTWYGVLMRPIWAAASLGSICGHAGLLVAHCAPCYAALALVVAGGGLAGAGVSRTQRKAPARAISRD